MATSDSREKHKEQKPESVHFWLAIVAGSLFFHSVLMFGVSRSVKVAVVEPGGGAIDVEFVEASGSKAASEGEPIVPASSFKPEPFRPEPTPLPEFTPEPIVKPEEKPIVKPEKEKPDVKEEKRPIVPKSEKPKEEKPKAKNTPKDKPATSKDLIESAPDTKGTGIQKVRFGAIGTPQLTPQSKGELSALNAEIGLPSITTIKVDPTFPLERNQIVDLKITITINNATGKVVLEESEALSIKGDWTAGLNLTPAHQISIERWINAQLRAMSFPKPKITVSGGAEVSPESEWLINFQLTGQ
jgi:hypothetical protein